MAHSYRLCVVAIALMLALVACTDMFMMIQHDRDCKAPPIEQNLVGTWKFGARHAVLSDTVSKNAPFTKATYREMGTMTFTPDKHLVDPDSLFSFYTPEKGRVKAITFELNGTSNLYQPSLHKELGELFWVRVYNHNRVGQLQITYEEYFKVIANECNRIHLKNPSGGLELVLVR